MILPLSSLLTEDRFLASGRWGKEIISLESSEWLAWNKMNQNSSCSSTGSSGWGHREPGPVTFLSSLALPVGAKFLVINTVIIVKLLCV